MAMVYIETSIVSHASSRPSSDPAIAALQSQARDWWQLERPKFELVTSQLVINEASLERLMMTQNPILDELRRTREELLANAGGTLAGLVAQLQEDERKSWRKVLDPIDLPRNRRRFGP